MSRSGYVDDHDDDRMFAMWRGRVASAVRGKRGQALLRDLRDALEAMPEKCLISDDLVSDGDVCALGAVAKHRAVPEIQSLDPENHELLGDRLNVAACLIQEIEWLNDEAGNYDETTEQRWKRVRRWVEENILEVA